MELALNIGILKQSHSVTDVPCQKALRFGVILSAFQVIDGIFTSIGINRFGTAMEGNPLIRGFMEEFGHVPTLAVLKFLAILVVLFVVYSSSRVRWAKSALGALSFVYLFMAILPWTYILFISPIA